jgi:tetratricopeptide (TPR) repeat protein
MRIKSALGALFMLAFLGSETIAVPPPVEDRQANERMRPPPTPNPEKPSGIMPRPAPRLSINKAFKGNPSLKARINGVESAATQSNALRISTLDMAVVVRGSIAETMITARLHNPSNSVLEGDFTFNMPYDSVITGYALDIQGTMVDGVLVPPRQAQLAYTQRVAQRIDPGIAEVTRGAIFNTKIFPIQPRQGRTIRLKYVTPLHPTMGYQLPLAIESAIGTFTLRIKTDGKYIVPIGLEEKETANGSVFSASQFLYTGLLKIMPEGERANMVVSEHGGEGRFFEINDTSPLSKRGVGDTGDAGGSLTILWDRSLSRLAQRHETEIALIKRYIATKAPKDIELILFDSGGADRLTFKTADEVAAKLSAVRYNGATSFATLSALRLDADTCLMFSDGIATIDKADSFAPSCRLFAITSTQEAEKGFLENRARKTGGALIDLTQTTVEASLRLMMQTVPSVVDVRSDSGEPIDYAVLEGGLSGWRIVGQAPNSGGVRVKIAGTDSGITERRYEAGTMTTERHNGPGALWAASKVSALTGEGDRKGALQIARRYAVASPVAAFIVFETPRDYAEAEIAPPSSYPKDLRAQYDAMAQAFERGKAEAQKQRLAVVASIWDETRDWWGKKHVPGSRADKQKSEAVAEDAAGSASSEAGDDSEIVVATARASNERRRPQRGDASPPPPSEPPPPPMAAPPSRVESVSMEDIGTTGALPGSEGALNRVATSKAKKADAGPVISLQPWASDRPYIKAYGNTTDGFWPAFAIQEKTHGKLPAFYLDTAEWLFTKGMKAEAIRMAESALELPTKNNVTLDILAARLLRYGAVDRAIGLLEQLVELEPDRPQPRRSLALALVKRASLKTGDAAKADLSRALTLLAEIINRPWDNNYMGVELVALFDANAIIPRLRSMGETRFPLDAKLIAPMESDIRIVVDWNTQTTDMDLWVDEPNGERVIYSDQRSSSGGHLSDDMTAGYGPEQYFIRVAPKGEYTIRMNTYATDRLNPNGATNVTARIIRNFGRPEQTEEMVDLEILPDKGGERLIGRIKV